MSVTSDIVTPLVSLGEPEDRDRPLLVSLPDVALVVVHNTVVTTSP